MTAVDHTGNGNTRAAAARAAGDVPASTGRDPSPPRENARTHETKQSEIEMGENF